MAVPHPLGTVIWFGSLEFMSLGYAYDMVLLPPRSPSDDNSSPRRQKRGRQPGHQGHHSHHARHMRWVRKNPHACSGIEGDSPSSPKSSHPTAKIGSLVRDMRGTHLATGTTLLAHGASARRCSRGSSRPVGSAPATRGIVVVPSSFPYGLNNVATGYSRSMRPTMSSYMGLPEHHLRTPLSSLRPHRRHPPLTPWRIAMGGPE
jgi:hypothetical protein